MADPRHLLGRRAEDAAAEWLTANGWQVLARRWRCGRGELDLVCRDRTGVLVGVEVKSRRSDRAGAPADSVDARRLARLKATLALFQAQRSEPAPSLRIDLVTAVPLPHRSAWRLTRTPQIDAW